MYVLFTGEANINSEVYQVSLKVDTENNWFEIIKNGKVFLSGEIDTFQKVMIPYFKSLLDNLK